jgi:hypothetical protein
MISFDDGRLIWLKQMWKNTPEKYRVSKFYSDLYNTALNKKSLTENQYKHLSTLLKTGKPLTENRILKYTEFMKESMVNILDKKWHSLGEYVEYIGKLVPEEKTDRFMQILGKYLNGTSADIRVANSVNLLPEVDQKLLVTDLRNEFDIKESVETAGNDLIKDIKNSTTPNGKWALNSFLKVISALGIKDLTVSKKQEPDFVWYYDVKNINHDVLSNVLERFPSLHWAITLLGKVEDNKSTKFGIYFGIKKGDIKFEYGILMGEKMCLVGEFQLSTGNINYIKELKNSNLKHLQKQLENIDYSKLKLVIKIIGDMEKFKPEFFIEKSMPKIENDIITMGYYVPDFFYKGVIKKEEFLSEKERFNLFILNNSWKSKVIYSVKENGLWIFYNVKIK